MSATLTARCHECFADAVLDGLCGKCKSDHTGIRRDRRALQLWKTVENKYRVGKVLGAGGFGITYIAEDVHLGRRVALKEYFPSGLVSRAGDGIAVAFNSYDDEAPFGRGLDRFFRESKLLAMFDHPNIVRVHEVFQANGTAYLAMEYLDGMTLKQWLADIERFELKKALRLMDFVFDALRAVHGKDIVHRDIKPDNIYITSAGRVLLLDFGGAKQLTAEGDRSMDAMFAHGYAAPEQYFSDSGKVGPWTDVYGAAATLYRMLTGEKLPSALERHADDPALDWHGTDVPASVRRAVAKAVSLMQSARFQTIADLDEAVSSPASSRADTKTDTLRTSNTSEAGVTGAGTDTWQPTPRPRTAQIALVATALVIAGVVAWQFRPVTPTDVIVQAPLPLAAPPASSLADARTKKILNNMLESAEGNRWAEVDASVLSIRPRDATGATDKSPRRSALLSAADEAVGNGNYARASELMLRATAEQPNDARAWFTLGYAAMRLNQPDEARRALTNGLALAADNGGAWAIMAELLAVSEAEVQSAAALQLAVYFSAKRADMLEQLTQSDYVAPQLRAIIRKQGVALERLPARTP